jgi:hypothetical protein
MVGMPPWLLAGQRRPKISLLANDHLLGRGKEGFPYRLSDGLRSCGPFDLGLLASTVSEMIHFYCLELQFGVLCYGKS